MSDREMLGLAAKAAGIDAHWGDGWQSDMMFRALPRPNSPLVTNVEWNPLHRDGDALRLAVKLGLHARQFPILDDGFDAPLGMVEVWRVDDDDPVHVEFLRSCDDRLAATRRAIVRAAAEIGKRMP